MSIEVFINNIPVVRVKGEFVITKTSNSENRFHDLARITHHAIDKAFKELSTVELTVKQEGGAK